MIFREPIDFDQALELLDQRDPLPTDLSSAEIREQWPEELRQRSIFSARTTKGGLLQSYKEQLGEMISGQTNVATARHEIQRLLKSMDYVPELGGFAGDTTVPPAEPGSLRDLSSNARIDLVLRTNVRQVAGAAQAKAGDTDSARFWYPAMELIRISPRRVPRGQKLAHSKGKGTQPHLVADPGKDWPSRWEKAGGEFYGGGRMIALKGSPVWSALGSSQLFEDGLDAPVPPFAFNSGYGWRAVARRDCLALGVIRGDAQPGPVEVRMNAGLQASVKNLDAATLAAIRSKLATRLEGAQLKLTGGKAS